MTISSFRTSIFNTHFRSLRRHLVNGAKSYVCSVNPTNLVLWFEALTCSLMTHVCLFLITRFWLINNTKVMVYKLGCDKIFHIRFDGQTLTAKDKGLTEKVGTKYLLTNWFPDYHF